MIVIELKFKLKKRNYNNVAMCVSEGHADHAAQNKAKYLRYSKWWRDLAQQGIRGKGREEEMC